jgi:TrkA domain protein
VAEVRETLLPGVGVRHEFTTVSGERVVLLTHRSGRRELAVYHRDDPDASTTVLHLSPEDARTFAELFGANQVSEALVAVQQQVEGLAIDWLTVAPGSRFAGATIGDGQFRTHTGSSIVAVVRGDTTIPAPGPNTSLEAGDVVVAVGTPDGLSRLRRLLGS